MVVSKYFMTVYLHRLPWLPRLSWLPWLPRLPWLPWSAMTLLVFLTLLLEAAATNTGFGLNIRNLNIIKNLLDVKTHFDSMKNKQYLKLIFTFQVVARLRKEVVFLNMCVREKRIQTNTSVTHLNNITR